MQHRIGLPLEFVRRTIRAIGGLGGGVALMGEACGALTGGVAALGLRFGRGHPSEREDPRLLQMGQELYHWFAASGQFKPEGTILCREITKTDLTDPAQLQAFLRSERLQECIEMTGRVAAKVASMLRREEGRQE